MVLEQLGKGMRYVVLIEIETDCTMQVESTLAVKYPPADAHIDA